MIAQKTIDKFFWFFIAAGVTGGFLFSGFFQQFECYVFYILMLMMGLLFLKIDILDIVTHIKKPQILLFIAFINLLLVPTIIYFIFRGFVDQDTLLGLVLISSLPAGIPSAVMTDIMRGRTPLSLMIIIVTNLLAAFTIPFIFWLWLKAEIELSYMSLFLDMVKLIAIPLILAKLLKKLLLKDHIIAKVQDYGNWIMLGLISLLMMISISFQAEYIIQNISELLKTLGILYLAFFLFQMIGYLSIIWRKKGGRAAVSNSNVVVNNFLGILLALAFFPPKVVTIVILSFIPWSTLIVLKHTYKWYRKFLPR
ncbi:bile acid:sodium symporter [Candidatus Margulisiibacteriota bacterium]